MNDYKIMIIDDEDIILDSIKDYFEDENIQTYNDPKNAIKNLRNNYFDIIITDYKMPDINGLELLIEAKKNQSYNYGILLTAYAEKSLLEQFINKNLINKIIEKPLKLAVLKESVDYAIDDCRKKKNLDYEFFKLDSFYKYAFDELNLDLDKIVGYNGSLKEIFSSIIKVSGSNENILITGETGTGKEVLAKTIHLLSKRKDKPFVKINCGAIPSELIESELFGYKKGAFTGATNDRLGKIELANNGTLFLDEIAELKPDMQTKLLHVIQDKKIERLGSNSTINVDFRLICATNKDLNESIKHKEFRKDLFYRINTIVFLIPPLRERINDIDPLIENITEKYSKEIGCKNIELDKSAIDILKKYDWPGNIRELENVIKRAMLLNNDKKIIDDKAFNYLVNCNYKNEYEHAIDIIKNQIINNEKDLNSIEKELLINILNQFNGNVMEAVKKTGIPKDRFYRMKK